VESIIPAVVIALFWIVRALLADTKNAAVPDEHRAVFSTLFHLATCLHKKGRFAEAEPLYRCALSIAEKVYGPEHAETTSTMGMLAKLYFSRTRALPL
jgi:hypothetical protein